MAKSSQQFNPNITLTKEESDVVDLIKTFTVQHLHTKQHAVFVLTGDAGTGKSVVLSNLFYYFVNASLDKDSPLYQNQHTFLVNHPELLKTYQQIAKNQPHVYQKDFQRPTSFINAHHKANLSNDITIIDEAHLLISQPDHYNHFMQSNQLAEIAKISQVTIIVFDPHQVVRTKSFWSQSMLDKTLQPYVTETYRLSNQHRMHASRDVINWLTNFGNGKVLPLPNDLGGYDLRIYDDCNAMYKDIVRRDHEAKLSRLLATLSYGSKVGTVSYVQEGNLSVPWDSYNFEKLPYPEIPKTLHEVGSMFTCQGFDLNYAGVIVGPSIGFDPAMQTLVPKPDEYRYPAAMTKRHDITDPETFRTIKNQLIMNDLNVLIKRGVKGLYLYVRDDALRHQLLNEATKIGIKYPQS